MCEGLGASLLLELGCRALLLLLLLLDFISVSVESKLTSYLRGVLNFSILSLLLDLLVALLFCLVPISESIMLIFSLVTMGVLSTFFKVDLGLVSMGLEA